MTQDSIGVLNRLSDRARTRRDAYRLIEQIAAGSLSGDEAQAQCKRVAESIEAARGA